MTSNGGRLRFRMLGTHSLVYSNIPQPGTRIDTSDSVTMGISPSTRPPGVLPEMISGSVAMVNLLRCLVAFLGDDGDRRRVVVGFVVLLGVAAHEVDVQQVLLLVLNDL